jgi:hypothetical protein
MPPNVDRITHRWQDGDAGRTELIPPTSLWVTSREFGNKARPWREVAIPASTESPLHMARQCLCAFGTLKRVGERKVISPGTGYSINDWEQWDERGGRDGLPASHDAK